MPGIRNLPDQRADALGLLKRVLHHLLQIGPVSASLAELIAVFLELADIDQERGQRPVELADHGGTRPIAQPRLLHGQGKKFKFLVARRDVLDPLRKLRITDPFALLRHDMGLTGDRRIMVNFRPSRTTGILSLMATIGYFSTVFGSRMAWNWAADSKTP